MVEFTYTWNNLFLVAKVTEHPRLGPLWHYLGAEIPLPSDRDHRGYHMSNSRVKTVAESYWQFKQSQS